MLRSGISRKQRFLAALDAQFAVPDENKIENWLVYARNLAAHIKYYRSDNKHDKETWQPFFDADVSAQLALIAVQDVNDFKDRIRGLLNNLLSEELKNDTPQLRKRYGLLFSAIFSLAYRIHYFTEILPEDQPLKRTGSNLVRTRLAPALRRLLGYYKAAVDFYSPMLVADEEVKDWTILAYPQVKLSEIISLLQTKLGADWLYKPIAATSFSDYYETEITADKTIYNHPVTAIAEADVWKVLNHAANHNLLTSVFAEFLSGYARLVKEAQQQLVKSITEQNTHEPHYALYLAFLQLFQYAQKDLNTYTSRHLDFYYKNVLRLSPKKSQPNHVHLVLELANHQWEYLVKKGTAFKAGKDSLGKDVRYTSNHDVVLNRATVAALKSFYRAGISDKIEVASQQGLLFASPQAASADGAGAKLTSASKDWHPFANKLFKDGALSAIAMPPAAIGFAVASHYLFLKEGKRKITITLQGQEITKLANKEFDCYLTTEKEWLQKTSLTLSTSASAGTATFTINISSDDPPITAFVPKVHLDPFQHIDTPVVKFVLKNVAGKEQYEELKEVKISSITVTVHVGDLNKFSTTGLKELQVSADAGAIDPSKPFLPFGQNPKSGASLIIGSKEIFSKQNVKVTAAVSWAEIEDMSIQDMDYNTTGIFFPTAQMKFLQNGVWTDGDFTSTLNAEHAGTPKKGELELFWGKDSIMMADVYLPTTAPTIPASAVVDYEEAYNPYGIVSQRGFLKLQLNDSFQFDEYFYALQLHLIGIANKNIAADATKPEPPYIPKVQSIFLNYEASATTTFASDGSQAIRLLHLYPFGYAAIGKAQAEEGKVDLLPQFRHGDADEPVDHIAEFYIGLQGAVPGQRVEVLFQVLEGSTDPQQSKPEEHVFWSYLRQNSWVDLDKSELNDGTRQLIGSGIISFPISADATSGNTLLPSGYHWLKAGIKELPEQVCRLVEVKAQALQVTFSDNQNAPDFLQQPLPANTIAKLQEPDTAIKKVEQPFASFGGRYQEDSQSFYTRVSERLRHKNRAITMRDIEQLVLEAFPDIHKVKCLNHTRLELLPTQTIYNEQAAGHTTVVTIPDLHQKNAINPLRPYTSRNRLEEIKEFLKKRSNCNMQLYVENPVFEEVRVQTQVVLRDEAAGNDAFYRQLLQEELVQFLTPWAFDLNTDIHFGGKISKSVLLNFIEERSYIDFILELKLFHNRMDGTPETSDQDQVFAATGRSILVSAPAQKHVVVVLPKPVKPEPDDCA
ncbi:baseplate J/gp47 family protein [Pontibacter qinzhouensis]|uniref:baseplate J/gp47 family protein n=1 Tax=Pontibacter qinzhouensis TaxID=2603253 RepID=UPI0011C89DE8|nr:baseplate J/gp47 family protein [Pontibacter qinzhouensis]